jgi:hypothetical protein
MLIENNADEVARWMMAVSKQVPYAASKALNKTLWDLRRLERREMKRAFKTPTPYAMRAIRYKTSNKRNLQGVLYINARAAKGNAQVRFLKRQVVGGGRRGKRIEGSMSKAPGAPDARHLFAVPGKAVKKNAYGNVARATQVTITKGAANRGSERANNRYFVKSKGGRPVGIYEKYGRKVRMKDGSKRKKIRPVMVFTRRPRYRKRFKFYGVGIRHASKRFAQHFDKMFNAVLLDEGLISPGMKVKLKGGERAAPKSDFKDWSERFNRD